MELYFFVLRCQCITGYTGPQCEENINECESNPCANQATCVDALNSFVCKCLPGFTGGRCETGTQDQSTSKNNAQQSFSETVVQTKTSASQLSMNIIDFIMEFHFRHSYSPSIWHLDFLPLFNLWKEFPFLKKKKSKTLK